MSRKSTSHWDKENKMSPSSVSSIEDIVHYSYQIRNSFDVELG